MIVKNEPLTRSSKMPRSYSALCRIFLPRPIHDRKTYRQVTKIMRTFTDMPGQMTVAQRDYFDLLCELSSKYEKVSHIRSKRYPIKLLKRLIDEHKMRVADLSPILGKSLSLGSMILSGQRTITEEHAERLANYFGLRPDEFLAQ